MKLLQRAKQLKRDIPAVFLALKHKDTPVVAKVFAAVAVGYALFPVDLIPDFIPVLGYLDDVLLLPVLISLSLKTIPDEVLEQCRIESEGMWADGKPQKWRYAIPVVFLWLVIVWLIVRAIWF